VRHEKPPVILEALCIEDYAAEGKSLARFNGKVIFIEKTVPGDVADVQLFKNKKDWAEGFPLRFHKLSEERVTPFCQHFGVCGGCQWQMLPYEKQLFYKQKQVSDILTRIGKIKLPLILPILGAGETRYYRNKLEYAFSAKQFIPEDEFRQMRHEGVDIKSKSEKNVAGFYAKGVFDKVVNIETCYLQTEPTNKIRNSVAEFARQHNFSFYDFRLHTGWLRNMQVRIATTGEIMLNIILTKKDEEKMKLLFDFILRRFPGITTLLYNINSKRNDSFFDLMPETVFGKGYIIEKLEDFSFKIGPKSFFQTNTKQAENLYRVARSFTALTGNETVYDLYCGTGSIGIFVSGLAKKIVGVDVVGEAIEDAKENAALNNISNAVFYKGDVTDICNNEFFSLNGVPDVIIVDPPRAGMHGKLVEKLLAIESPLIVYVSCNPATQARDVNILDEKYAVEKVQPLDMFPHTHHIENIMQLKLRIA
jgi:23S rRNA (uracil1939-C5)-methyltransferase